LPYLQESRLAEFRDYNQLIKQLPMRNGALLKLKPPLKLRNQLVLCVCGFLFR
jgi:hypothetical protein